MKKDTIRLSTGCHEKATEINYIVPHFHKTKEIVDMSMFQPISETIKRLNGSRELTGDEVKMYYDFSSGSDNHGEIPYSRSAECVDIAMLSSHIREGQAKIKGTIDKHNTAIEAEKARKARIASIKGEISNSAE